MSIWRQLAAAIIKEKFSIAEQANFDLDTTGPPDNIEDENEIMILAEINNYNYRTFNYTYVGITTFTLIVLLYCNRRTSNF